MARGSASKEIITAKILEAFPGSFKYDKEIRIPIEENGECIQVKVTLTAAKTNVDCGGDTVLPGAKPATAEVSKAVSASKPEPTITEPTDEEKSNLAALMASLF